MKRRFEAFPAILCAMFLMGDAIAQTTPPPEEFTIARLKYRGGGDWYGDPSSLPNLLAFIRNNTNMRVAADEARVDITQPDLFSYPYLYLTGHGNVRFADEEVKRLRSYLTSGGFLHADDNYGMDFSFRRELKRIFPDKDLVDLPFSHPIYHAPFDFARGMPKIHKHDGKRARGLGIFHKGRLVVFYSYETDLGDGWEDAPVHGDPASKRLAALRMGTNIVVYALTH